MQYDKFTRIFGHLPSVILFMIFAAFSFADIIYAQQPTAPTAADIRKAEAEARKAEADARKAQAEARLSEINNRIKELEMLQGSKGGNDDASNAPGRPNRNSGSLIETKISAYKAVACSANLINARIARLQNRIDSLMIYNRRFVNTLSEYSVLMHQLKIFDGKYKEVFRKNEKTLTKLADQPSEATRVRNLSFIDPIEQIRELTVDTLALFRTDTSVEGTAVTIGKDEFIAQVVKNLTVDVYYPDKAIPVVTDSSPLLALLSELAAARLKAADTLSLLNKSDDLYFQLQAVNEQYDRTLIQFSIASAARPAGIKDRISQAEFDALADDLQLYYTETTEGNATIYVFDQRVWAEDHGALSGLNIVDYLQAETAFQRLSSTGSDRNFWLDVDVAETGSNMRSKSSPVVDIFTGGQRLSFSGGAVVTYRIFDLNGKVLASDTILTYMPFKKSGDITEFVCSQTNTNVAL